MMIMNRFNGNNNDDDSSAYCTTYLQPESQIIAN